MVFLKMFNRIKKVAKVAGATAVTYSVLATSAIATSPQDIIGNIDNQASGTNDLLVWIRNAINLAIGLSALVAVVYLVYSGFSYIMSAGDEGKVEKATKGITNAVIGLVICFISVMIINFVLQYVIK